MVGVEKSSCRNMTKCHILVGRELPFCGSKTSGREMPLNKKRTTEVILLKWWALRGSNSRHLPCKGSALPTELNAHTVYYVLVCKFNITEKNFYVNILNKKYTKIFIYGIIFNTIIYIYYYFGLEVRMANIVIKKQIGRASCRERV